jgi:hypothetical protein
MITAKFATKTPAIPTLASMFLDPISANPIYILPIYARRMQLLVAKMVSCPFSHPTAKTTIATCVNTCATIADSSPFFQ